MNALVELKNENRRNRDNEEGVFCSHNALNMKKIGKWVRINIGFKIPYSYLKVRVAPICTAQ